MTTFYLSTDPSGISDNTVYWNGRLNCLPGNVSLYPLYLTIENGNNAWHPGCFITKPFMLKKASWVDGSIILDTGYATSGAANITLVYQCIASRITESGQVRETTLWSNEASTTANAQHAILTIPSHNWDHEDIQDTDRLRIDWRVKCTSFDGTDPVMVTMHYSGAETLNKVDLPFTIDHLDHFINYQDYNYLTSELTGFFNLYGALQSSHISHPDAVWNRYLRTSPEEIDETITVSIPKDDSSWHDAYFYTDIGVIRKSQWRNTLFRVILRVTQKNDNMEVRSRAARVNRDGVIQEQNEWGTATPVNTNGYFEINPGLEPYEWDFENIQNDDLYLIQFQFRNLATNQAQSASFYLTGPTAYSFPSYDFPPKPMNLPELSIGEPLITPTGTLVEGSLDSKGEFDLPEETFEGYFSYAPGSILLAPTPVDKYDFNVGPLQDFPGFWGAYYQSVVRRVQIISATRGTIYDVSDTNSSLRLKDKTASALQFYPGEELTVSIDYYSSYFLFTASIFWGNSFITDRNPEFIKKIQVQSESISETGFHTFSPSWVVPANSHDGYHLLYFGASSMGTVPQTWLISGFIGERGAKIAEGEWFKNTTAELLGEPATFEQELPLEEFTNYVVAPSVHILSDSVYKYTHRPTPYAAYVNPTTDLKLTVKDVQANLLGSTNILDKFTTEEWNEATSSDLVVEDKVLRLPGGN